MSGQRPDAEGPRWAVVGSRTTRERDARGEGLEVFDMTTVPWRHAGSLLCTNPSFLAAGVVAGDWYVAHGDEAVVSRVRVDASGTPELLDTVDSGGTNPVHLCVADGWLLVVNHSGSLVALQLDADGRPGGVVSRVDFTGRPGPHATDQGRAKPHQVVPLGDGLFLVPDKGLDTVHVVRLDATTGELALTGGARLRELSGPRHIAVHPSLPVGYTIDELSSTVTVLSLDGAEVMPLQVHSTLDPDAPGDSRGAEVLVSPDGRWVVASNRSGAGDRTPGGPDDDAVAVFLVRPDGRLDRPTWRSVGGIRPRFATWLPGGVGDAPLLVVANERSDTIVLVDLDGAEPRLLARTGSPVCVVFQ